MIVPRERTFDPDDAAEAGRRPHRRFPRWFGLAFVAIGIGLCILAPQLAVAADDSASPNPLIQLPIEDLAKISVSSVSKAAEPLSDAPAAIYVISHDDIIRSGATSIPEMLRMAPNLDVAQVNASSYAISARGFNGSLSDKLLVLIDGRSVYSPLYAGVQWDLQYVPPEDIERIEVISGPGGTLWGANAVNGVINIITRNSRDTQGGLMDVGGGNRQLDGFLQYGGKIGDNTTYRVYGNGFTTTSSDLTTTGMSAHDQWDKSQGGFRMDWSGTADRMTLQGDAFIGSEQQVLAPNTDISGQNLLARWNHQFDGGSALQVQTYYDGTRHFTGDDNFSYAIDTYDLEVQHSFALNDWNAVVWGGDERAIWFDNSNVASITLTPAKLTTNTASLFVEDTMSLTNRVKLIPGFRIADDPFVGLEPLPSLRASWKITDTALLWSAVSRAVHSPTPLDTDFTAKVGNLVELAGNPDLQSEKLTAYEIGYRAQPIPDLSFSVSSYFNVYDDLRSLNVTPGATLLPLTFTNDMQGHTYGVEFWASYRINDWWRLGPGFNILREHLRFKSGETTLPAVQLESLELAGDDPGHQVLLRSSMNIGPKVTFDTDLRQVGSLPDPAVRAYVELGLRLGWKVSDTVQVALTGANLLHAHHVEFGATPGATAIGRTVFANVQVRF